MLELINIRHKLWLLIVFPIIALALLLGYAFNRYAHLESEVESLYADRVVPLIQIKKVSDHGAIQIVDILHKYRAGLVSKDEVLVQIADATRVMNDAWQSYLNTYLVTAEQVKVELIEFQLQAVFTHIATLQSAINQGTFLAIPQNQFVTALYEKFDPLTSSLQALTEVQNDVALSIVEQTEQQFSQLKLLLIIFSVIVLVSLIAVGLALYRSIQHPINHIRSQINHIIESSSLEKRIDIDNHNELTDVSLAINQLLSHIHVIHQQLVEAEKLSSLGSLVSGLAHEVNTPLGVSITAVSSCQEQVDVMETGMKTQRLSHAEFLEIMAALDSGLSIAERNLGKTAKLVQEFKNISAEQETDVEQLVDLEAIIRDYCEQTARFQLKMRVEFSATGKLEQLVKINVKALQQILLQLLENARVHGFSNDSDTQPFAAVRLEITDNKIFIRVKDEGVGMSNEVLNRIFEPFYTTARQHGHAGLGLSVTYNLVKKHLEGDLKVNSKAGNGTTFTILLANKTLAQTA
ncbi:ATP-binding protein [Pseudoalteromonas piscicida]|uniref:ATP-binding protein n=1 Tax=Pseudoalteromonas piscicida TaxID=43662 RepID=UPI0027E3CC45|nr:ATP-binding protein [Pseudoalteromonas piscicida]WMO13824.1 ATP-binding protein [Pseudoalteromonas piscicida]